MSNSIRCCHVQRDPIDYYDHLRYDHCFDAGVSWLLAVALVAGIELDFSPSNGGVTIWGRQDRLLGA